MCKIKKGWEIEKRKNIEKQENCNVNRNQKKKKRKKYQQIKSGQLYLSYNWKFGVIS